MTVDSLTQVCACQLENLRAGRLQESQPNDRCSSRSSYRNRSNHLFSQIVVVAPDQHCVESAVRAALKMLELRSSFMRAVRCANESKNGVPQRSS